MKKLIIGHFQTDTNADDIVILGPWSFLNNQKRLFEKKIKIEPDPYSSVSEIEKDSLVAQKIIDQNLSFIVEYLNEINSSNYTKNFWKILIMPWLSTLTQITIERFRRIENLLKIYDLGLEVELFSNDESIKFNNTKDFFDNGVLSVNFNHWLFSRIIEHNDKNFKISWCNYSDEQKIHNASKKKHNAKEVIRNIFYRFFPSSTVYGISFIESPLWESFIYFKKLNSSTKAKKKKRPQSADYDSMVDWKKLMIDTLPEEFKKIPNDIKRPKPRFILVGQRNFYQINAEKKLSLAMHKEVGSRIICSQHGSRYGTLKCIPYINSIEYDQDWFISWGWVNQSKYDVGAINLPAPYLINKRKKTVNHILFVGQDSPLFSYRLDSIPQPRDFIDIVSEIEDFILALSKENTNNLRFRFYPEKKCTIDYDFLFKKYINNESKYIYNKKHIFSSKLLIIDHPGTIFHQRMALNLPTIGFWDKSKWGICDQAKPYFENLRLAGVIQNSGLDAAKKVNDKYCELESWWMNKDRQKAVKDWNDKYARTDKKWRKVWMKSLWKI